MGKAELWRNRIIGSAEVPPDSLLAHPSNWRGHPANQQNALTDILGGDDGVGWLDTVMVNKRTSELWPDGDRGVETVVDGHLRVALAMRHNQPTVPVRYVDLTPAEEALALATFDPIGALATAQAEQLDAVLREVNTGSEAVGQMLEQLAARHGVIPPNDPLEEWKGMPEFENEKIGYRSLMVHFETEADVTEFVKIIGQDITEKTRAIWYPEKERQDIESKRWENES